MDYFLNDIDSGKKYKITVTECDFCFPDGTSNNVPYPDGYICRECGGKHYFEEAEFIE